MDKKKEVKKGSSDRAEFAKELTNDMSNDMSKQANPSKKSK